MSKIHLFESGSTKTTLLSIDTTDSDLSNLHEVNLPGYNPNRSDASFFNILQEEHTIESEDYVFFYGSGLGNEVNKQKVKAFFQKDIGNTSVEVYDDILGAGRALFGHEPGILAILGTGGCTAWYDGEKIEERRGGYGYLIDDFGGGYELGKIIISHWLNGDWPAQFDEEIAGLIGVKKENFTQQYYTQPDLALVASLSKLILKYVEDETVRFILVDYFKTFFIRHLLPLSHKKGKSQFKTVGSIATAFSKIIEETANLFNLRVENHVRYPAISLLEFHLNALAK